MDYGSLRSVKRGPLVEHSLPQLGADSYIRRPYRFRDRRVEATFCTAHRDVKVRGDRNAQGGKVKMKMCPSVSRLPEKRGWEWGA